MIKELERLSRKLNIVYDEKADKKLTGYMDGILSWNEKVNLTAITDRGEFIQKHYVDSIVCAGLTEFKLASRIIDVGTGGGFPGVPLAALFPDKEFVLVDSLRKRLRIIDELCGNLGIVNVKTVHGRAEELARQETMREKFDLCVSRAVANMSALAEYCLPFVEVGGHFIAYKGPDCENEVAHAKRAIEILGGEILRIKRAGELVCDKEGLAKSEAGDKGREDSSMRAQGADELSDVRALPFYHKLIVIRKKKNTLSKYPRRAGVPSKEPII